MDDLRFLLTGERKRKTTLQIDSEKENKNVDKFGIWVKAICLFLHLKVGKWA